MSSKDNRTGLQKNLNKSVHVDMKLTKRELFQTKNCKINPFVVEPFLESNCKRSRNSAIREKFNIQHNRNDVQFFVAAILTKTINLKKKLYPFSFHYVWTTLGHKIPDIYASQNVQVFNSPRKPETYIRQHQDQQRAGALTGCKSISQNGNKTVIGMQHKKSEITFKKTFRADCLVSRSNQTVNSSLFA